MTAMDIVTYRKSTDWACRNERPIKNHLGPEALICDVLLSRDEKRAILADWACDARAVEHMPGYRQLDNGALIWLDDIWVALRKLDGDTETLGRATPVFALPPSGGRNSLASAIAVALPHPLQAA